MYLFGVKLWHTRSIVLGALYLLSQRVVPLGWQAEFLSLPVLYHSLLLWEATGILKHICFSDPNIYYPAPTLPCPEPCSLNLPSAKDLLWRIILIWRSSLAIVGGKPGNQILPEFHCKELSPRDLCIRQSAKQGKHKIPKGGPASPGIFRVTLASNVVSAITAVQIEPEVATGSWGQRR